MVTTFTPLGRQRADRLAHRRVVERDDADALGLAVQVLQQSGEPIGIEAFDGGDMDVEIGARLRLRLDLAVQHLDEGVGARRQREIEPDDIA